MKKAIALFLCLVAVFSLSACGAPKQVPDQTIAWAVEDYLKGCGYGTASEFSYETIHSADDPTNTDTVDIALSAVFPTASISTSCSATYQYNKSSDLWSVIRGGEWGPVSVSSYRFTVSPEAILKTIKQTDTAADFKNEVSLQSLADLDSKTEAINNWCILGHDSMFEYCESADPEIAYDVFLKALFTYLLDERIDNFASNEIDSAIGENYHCLKRHFEADDTDFDRDIDIYLIHQNNMVLIFGSCNNETSKNIFDSVGFIPDMVWKPFDVELDFKKMLYKVADSFLKSGDYESAERLFAKLGNFEDSASRAVEAVQAKKAAEYAEAEALFDSAKYDEAKKAFLALDDYNDSTERVKEIEYIKAETLLNQGNTDEAITAFQALGEYKDCKAIVEEIIEARNSSAYENALAMMNSEDFEAAFTVFLDLGGYRDSAELAEECEHYITVSKEIAYENALAMKKSGNYAAAITAFLALEGYRDSAAEIEKVRRLSYQETLAQANVGDFIFFGNYEQDNKKMSVMYDAEPIEWQVLAKEDNKILLISKYALDCQKYNASFKDSTWENCTLRKWLNSTFLRAGFTDFERSLILNETVNADINPEHETSPGNNTTDQIFLLSAAEVNMYFNSDDDRVCAASEFCEAQGAKSAVNGGCWWWTRSPGNNPCFAACVSYGGSINDYVMVNMDDVAVRPALWVDLAP